MSEMNCEPEMYTNVQVSIMTKERAYVRKNICFISMSSMFLYIFFFVIKKQFTGMWCTVVVWFSYAYIVVPGLNR